VRARMFGDAPNEGTVALVGYGGGYHAISPVDNDDLTKGAIQVIYCPYDFNASGVAQKAHVITLDPTSGNESISVVHANGAAILLQDDLLGGSVQLQSPDSPSGSGLKVAVVTLKPGEINMQADQIVLNGTVKIGDPNLGVPLLAGPASAPCPRLFLSPTP